MDSIDTSIAMGQFFSHITGAFADLDRNLIHERTMAGLRAARERGAKGGRPKAINKETFELAAKMYQTNDFTVNKICEKLNLRPRCFIDVLQSKKNQTRHLGG